MSVKVEVTKLPLIKLYFAIHHLLAELKPPEITTNYHTSNHYGVDYLVVYIVVEIYAVVEYVV